MLLLAIPFLAFAQAPPPPPPQPPPPPPGTGAGRIGSTIWFDSGAGGPGSVVQANRIPRQNMPPPERTGDAAIEGTVVNALTGAPIRRANVMLFGPGVGQKTATTDASGAFRLDQLPDGPMNISAHHGAFASVSNGSGRIILKAGEKKTGFVVKLQPGAVISGRVVDEDGEPAVGVQVSLMRRTEMRGAPMWAPMNGSASDDRGEYRIHSIPPGRYRLAANGFIRPTGQGTGVTYHPSTFRLKPASEVKADLQLRKNPGGSVEGRIIGLPEGHNQYSVNAWPVERADALGPIGVNTIVHPDRGAFSITGLEPGKYRVGVRVMDGQEALTGIATTEVAEGAPARVDVRLSKAVALSGRVRMEGATAPPEIGVTLLPGGPAFAMRPHSPSAVSADGTFKIASVTAGVWDIAVQPMPQGAYIKSMMLGTQDVLREEMVIGGVQPPELEIVLSPKSATLEGSVSGFQPESQAMVVAMPEGRERSLPGFRMNAPVRPDGKFMMSSLRPGSYKLAAVSASEMMRLMDPDILEALPMISVKLEEGSRSQQDLPLLTTAEIDKAEESLQ